MPKFPALVYDEGAGELVDVVLEVMVTGKDELSLQVVTPMGQGSERERGDMTYLHPDDSQRLGATLMALADKARTEDPD